MTGVTRVARYDGASDDSTASSTIPTPIVSSVAGSVAEILKLKGRVEVMAPGSLPRDGLVIEDRRSYD